MLKKYFNTPKMPLSFYISDLTIYNLLMLLLIYFVNSINNPSHKLVIIILHAVLLAIIVLQSYTWSWFCDYMLFKYGKSVFVQFMFRPFGITKKGAATAAMISFATDVQHDVTWDKWGYAKVSRNYSSNFKSLGCMAVLLLFPRLMLASFIAPWTIIFHVWIIKQYQKEIQEELKNSK
ncbi:MULTISPECIES: hypothetical protein [Streptococcus]|uniref:Uncharacterized protein n=1 Tax=Streptococcus caledonicus TaxID=2614158 RepID=A0ABW0UFI6_9STRE|nr:hypothetical protein [Streptococcus sp. S784/96/1]